MDYGTNRTTTSWENGRTVQTRSPGMLRLIVGIAVAACLISRPARAEAADAVLVGAGDIAQCSDGLDGEAATATLIDSIDGTVMAIGDTVQGRGEAVEYTDCYAPTWGRFLDRTRPAVGNHEYLYPGAANYFEYFDGRADPAGRGGWYAYSLGDWRIYVLNSNCNAGVDCTAELSWLKSSLNSHPHECVAAYWHHPMFSSAFKHSTYPMVHPLFEVLYRHRADVLITGHHHVYERFAKMNPDGVRSWRGIREFVVGTGGTAINHSFSRVMDGSLKRIDDTRGDQTTTWGVLKLSLHDGSYRWQFIDATNNAVLDTGTSQCVA